MVGLSDVISVSPIKAIVYGMLSTHSDVECRHFAVIQAITATHRHQVLQMDKFDQKILDELRRNARQSVSAIAEQVSLSRSAVSERIKRMEDSGEILGYQVISKPQHNAQVKAYFEVRHNGYHCESIAEKAMHIQGIKLCHGISGDLDLLIYAEADAISTLHVIRSQLEKIAHVGTITTHIVMGEWTSEG